MEIKIFTIAGGNTTALVYDCPVANREKTSKELLKEVEQIGFISMESMRPELTMMGGEFCLNATLAFASALGERGELTTSGLKRPVPYINTNELTTIQIPFKFSQDENIIVLEGIGFVLYDRKDKSEIKKDELSNFSKKYALPAFGGIVYRNREIAPYVYVARVNSFVKETACGSGSVAYSLYSGVTDVV